MNNLVLLPTPKTSKERINNKIESFRKDFLMQDGDLETANLLIEIAIDYLSQFDDDIYLDQAFLKLNESYFFIDKYMFGWYIEIYHFMN